MKNIDDLSNSDLYDLAITLQREEDYCRYHKAELRFLEDGECRRELYPAHLDFFKATATFPEVAFVAANRVGKTDAMAYLVKCLVTGLYPDWWEGIIFNHSIRVWIVGKTSEKTAEVLQSALLGEWGDFGSGMIPKDCLGPYNQKSGVTHAVHEIKIKHKPSGSWSTITFKSHDQERKAFEGHAVHVICFDEECLKPMNYTECLLRTMKLPEGGRGLMISTFTPLDGLTPNILQFLPGGRFPKDGIVPSKNGGKSYKYVVNCTWEDVPHLTKDEKDHMLSEMPPHEREARSRGIPWIGVGQIYPVLEENIVCKPFKIPTDWPRAFGLDFGFQNGTAAIWIAEDPNTGIKYLYDEYFIKNQPVPIHASSIRARGHWVLGACDPSGGGAISNQTENLAYMEEYELNGVTLVKGINAYDPLFSRILNMFLGGTLKIFSTCGQILDNIRMYRRGADGKPIKEDDHLPDAMRYLISVFSEVAQSEDDARFLFNDNSISNRRSGRDRLTGY